MNSCTSCGHESASTARFCSECGLPLLSPAKAGAEVVTGVDKSHWLTSSEASADGAVRHPTVKRGVKHPLAVVAAGLILAVVGWNLFRAPTVEVEGLVGDLDVVSRSTSSTTSGGDDNSPADDDTRSTTVAPEQVTVDVVDLDPALSGYHLFAQQSGRILRVDLADGSVETNDVPGGLIGDYAGRLYFVDRSGGVFSLPLDELGAEPSVERVPIEPGRRDLIAAALTSEGLVHLTIGLFSSALPELEMIRLDLTTGSTQQVELEQYGAFGVVEVPAAGLFELTGDGFRPLADGSVRLHGERLIVIEECDAPGRCRRYWLDRQTGQEIDRPVPEGLGGWLIGPGGRVAVTFTPRGRVFVDTETGETLPDLIGHDGGDGSLLPDDVTPDERFLAAVPPNGSGDVRIHDLERGVTWAIELPRTFNLSKVLFVPKQNGGR